MQNYYSQLEKNNEVMDHNLSRFSITIKNQKEKLEKTEKKFKKLYKKYEKKLKKKK